MSAPSHLLQHVQKLRTKPHTPVPKRCLSLVRQSQSWEEGSVSMAESLRAVSRKSMMMGYDTKPLPVACSSGTCRRSVGHCLS